MSAYEYAQIQCLILHTRNLKLTWCEESEYTVIIETRTPLWKVTNDRACVLMILQQYLSVGYSLLRSMEYAAQASCAFSPR